MELYKSIFTKMRKVNTIHILSIAFTNEGFLFEIIIVFSFLNFLCREKFLYLYF